MSGCRDFPEFVRLFINAPPQIFLINGSKVADQVSIRRSGYFSTTKYIFTRRKHIRILLFGNNNDDFCTVFNEAPDLDNGDINEHYSDLNWLPLWLVSIKAWKHIHNSHQWRCQIANIRENFNFLCCFILFLFCCGKQQLVFCCWRINTVSHRKIN